MAEGRRSLPVLGEAGTGGGEAEAVLDVLRQVPYPGYDRDIVSFGLVEEIEAREEGVRIRLVVETGNEDVPEQLRRAIEEELRGNGHGPVEVEIRRPGGAPGSSTTGCGRGGTDGPDAESRGESGRPMTPLQAELAEEGMLPEPDPLGRARTAPGTAPGAGYGAGGPTPLAGPGGVGHEDRVARQAPDADAAGPDLPVYQWEIDPGDEDLDGGEVEHEADGWHFRMWWREHPEELVYASIQALRSDAGRTDAGDPRHPVGRAVAVNLVYDRRREGVAAVYGTVRDFRPFVKAFEDVYSPAPVADGGEASSAGDGATDISDGSGER